MVPNSLPQYRCSSIEGVEKVTGYRTGGFCPISIGQMLDDKYEIFAKLGHGGFSTVWLAKDVSVKTSNSWVALKILKSEKSSKDNSELAILRSVRHTNIVQCLNYFWIHSPNGYHLCLVMEATGPAIRLYVEPMCAKSPPCMILDMLMEVNVSLANFVLGLTDISGVTKETMHHYLGVPRTGLVSSRAESALPAAMPQHLFISVSLKDLFDSSVVKMIDFGEAFSGWKRDVATHIGFRSQELLAGQGATVKSDIWSMGCLIFELMTSHSLFCGNSVTVAEEQALFFIKGPDEQYEYIRQLLSEHSILEYEEDNDLLAGLLVHILVQNPYGRVSLGHLLEHDFFKFAGRPPQSGISIRSSSPATPDHLQGSSVINSPQQGPSADIYPGGLENCDAKHPFPISNSPHPSSGRRVLPSRTGQALGPSKSKPSRKNGQPAGASLSAVRSSKVSRVAGKKRPEPQRRRNISPKAVSGSLPLFSSVDVTQKQEPSLVPVTLRRSPRIQPPLCGVNKESKRTTRSKSKQKIADNMTARSFAKPRGISKRQRAKSTQGRGKVIQE